MSRQTKNPLCRVHCFGFAFTPHLIPSVFLLLALPLLISLGTWQLHRAAEKRQLQTQFHHNRHIAITLDEIKAKPASALQYRKIRVTGHYDNAHPLLIDNKISHHRIGYDVITPFIPNHHHKILLVNRGWISGTRNRNQLPHITPIIGEQTIEGQIKSIPEKVFLLSQKVHLDAWPLLIQALSLQQITQAYQKPLFPFVVLLSPTSPSGYTREWRPTLMTPEKHVAYAMQWFALALTLVIIYLALNTQRRRYGKPKKQ